MSWVWVCTSRSWHIAIPWLLLDWAQQMQQAVPLLLSKYWLSIIISFKILQISSNDWHVKYATNLKHLQTTQPARPRQTSECRGPVWSLRWLKALGWGAVDLAMSTSAGNLVSSQNGALLVMAVSHNATRNQKKTRHHVRPTLTNRDWPLCFLQFSALQRFVGEAMLASTQGWYWLQLTAGIQLWLPYLSLSQGMWPASLEDWPEICGEVSGPADRGILPIFSA